jgi:hypothetical protein
MSGEQFVIEWADSTGSRILAVHKLSDWLQIKINDRNWNTALVHGTDELDIYMRAMRGEYD